MSHIVVVSGNPRPGSRTSTLAVAVGEALAAGSPIEVVEVGELGAGLLTPGDEPTAKAIRLVREADVLVVATPTYKGSYTGLFKHAIDLIDPGALLGRPVILTATGGGDRHALIVEHQLRPLFGFFQAHALPSAVYAADRDFVDYRLAADPIRQRVQQAVDELAPFVPAAAKPATIAAE